MFFQMGLGVCTVPMFKIYVGNLDPRVTIAQVREIFSPFATIEDAVLVSDSKTGKLKGFAIVMIRDEEIGRAAVKATQGKRLLGKTLTINEVMKKGAAAAKAAKEIRQGPFGPHFNRQGGGRAGGGRGGLRRGQNRGPRGPSSGFGASGGGFASGLGGPGAQSFRPMDRPVDRPVDRPMDRPSGAPPQRFDPSRPPSDERSHGTESGDASRPE
ncbi:MAG: hypothetical protein GC172_04390 [Phycisphaera sp.]|nr:hypothetical protein [Phycisphaera sp.]